MNVLINILTRTSNRPIGFEKNIKSVKNQTYKNINHIIATDDKNSISYIEKNGITNHILIDRENLIKNDKSINPKTGRYSPHNLYFNEMIKYMNDGWVIYLDDDDRFVDNTCVQQIADLINKHDEDTLFFWQMVYSSGKYLPKGEPNPPKMGRIGSPCFTFHIKWKEYVIWDGWKCSDFRIIYKLYNIIPKKVWYPKKLIFIPKPGLGLKKDIK